MPVRRSAIALAASLALGLLLSGPAAARIYWANEAGNSIGLANNDGSGESLNFIASATSPRGVAIGGPFIYWAHGGAAADAGRIGRGRLDGTGTPDQALVSITGTAPGGIAVDGSSIYWTHVVPFGGANQCFSGAGCGKIGTAGLDGSEVNQLFVPAFPASLGTTPCALATEPDHFYWSDGATGKIGQAHGPFAPNNNFITGASDPCGVAFASSTVYWANRGSNTIGRATYLGTDVNQSFIDTGAGNSPCGVAVDASYIYWTTANGMIWRRNVDGSGVNQSIVTDALGPCGIAVDPTARAVPAASMFDQTAVGSKSDIQSFYVQNTSSSVLNVSDVSLVGPHPGDFEKTGDGCTFAGVAPGGSCVLNARFAPTATGPRIATLRVTSNATDSPADIVLTGTAIAASNGGTGGGSGGGEGGAPSGQTASSGTQAGTDLMAAPPLADGRPVSPATGLSGFRSTLTVGATGAVVLCRASNPPTASATQTLVGRLPTASARGAKSRRRVLGRGRTVIPDGETRSVVARLSGRARRALRSRGSLAAVSEIVAVGPGGERETVKRRVTLRSGRR